MGVLDPADSLTVELTEVQQLAGRLVGKSQLIETRLFGSACQHVRFPEGDGQIFPGEVVVDVQSQSDQNDAVGVYLLSVQVPLLQDVDEEPLELATFQVTYGALYAIDDEVLDATRSEREAFGQCVAALALWPFARSEIAHMSSSMNSPVQMLLPVLTQRDVVNGND